MLKRRDFLIRAGAFGIGLLAGMRSWAAALLATEPNPLGPYYRKGAPFRTKLAEGVQGTPLGISGKVLSVDGTPLKGAVLDLWHADTKGNYDNESDKFLCRGCVKTDENGAYAFETIAPGHYFMGDEARPSHIHYKVDAEGCKTLVTQLYFKGDPWLATDPLDRASLIIEPKDGKGCFDIVLEKA